MEQGEWIFDPEILCSDIGVYSAGYRCSICGKDYFKVDGIRFCPNCGADMRSKIVGKHADFMMIDEMHKGEG